MTRVNSTQGFNYSSMQDEPKYTYNICEVCGERPALYVLDGGKRSSGKYVCNVCEKALATLCLR